MAQYFLDLVYTLINCMSCFPGSPQLKINNRSFKILRLLGEGGFSYVYLVQDTSNEALYALKKIRCPFGQESVAQAMKEVEAYALFTPHPNIICSVDYCVSSDRSDPGAKTVYILLPYYRRGNLQDIINANLVNHTKFPERRLMVLFLGVCKALKAMHNYKEGGGPGGVKSQRKAKKIRGEAAQADQEEEDESEQRRGRQKGREVDPDSEQQEPLMDGEVTQSQVGVAPGDIKAYAHRDIKPGKQRDREDDEPILMDLGSLAPSPTPITSRSLALAVQDQAAEHSTMPYRAPELFDVKTGSTVDTKVDIWSLGCTLYACLVGKSPFEMRSDETGGSLSLCVLGGDWRFPDEGAGGKKKAVNQPGQSEDSEISESIREVVRKCLRVEPAERPDVNELIDIVETVIGELPEDGTS
ncbi:serine/threonine kinase 16 [Drepanopeziza brunnea f. sp. 'multigermtubi' MB_m1]|uniref:non-specific serine/threonine protein kinase n=1 Tax=Marssonina brunnea f. sp. multigermtubi (strain MB_m1) TaxID=1072389 RepID=K1XWV1_MARBU|nr:serine/threonine kinase 16 [Drepanopeziza brunnea f. sp. 'multigermtubi' MB_m1]EKD17229.1 serine/threonine kinase 16 [Drepanopeziza brunnea f. sp. 'multigermtubi' MB_m1]